MAKTRILVVGDKSVANTGFAILKKNLLKRLQEKGRYEVAEFAFAGNNSEKEQVSWKYYPTVAGPQDPDFKDFSKNPQLNKNGGWRWDKTVLDFKPDIILCVQDVWMSAYIGTSAFKDFYHVCAAVPVDSHPQPQKNVEMYASMDTLVPYTQYAKDCLEESGLDSTFPIGCGVDPNIFKPINKERAREAIRLPKNGTAFGFIGRNQPRKRIPELFQAYRKYLDRTQDYSSYLILHTTYPESVGWNIPQHLLEYQLCDNVYFTYLCQQTGKPYMSKFKDTLSRSPFTGNYSSIHNSSNFCLSEDYMANVYNAMDLYIQCANCEGFGIPIIEAAACENRVVSIDHSAMAEVTTNCGGTLVKPATQEFCLDIKTQRACVDIDAIADIMVNWRDVPRASRSKTLLNYSWDVIVEQWEKLVTELKYENQPWDAELRPEIKIEINGGNYTPSRFVLEIADKIPACMGLKPFTEIDNVTKVSLAGGNTQHMMQNIVNRYSGLLNMFNTNEKSRIEGHQEEYWMK